MGNGAGTCRSAASVSAFSPSSKKNAPSPTKRPSKNRSTSKTRSDPHWVVNSTSTAGDGSNNTPTAHGGRATATDHLEIASVSSQHGAQAEAIALFHALDCEGKCRTNLPILDVRHFIRFLARQGLLVHVDVRLHPIFHFLVEEQELDAQWLWRFCEEVGGGSGSSLRGDGGDINAGPGGSQGGLRGSGFGFFGGGAKKPCPSSPVTNEDEQREGRASRGCVNEAEKQGPREPDKEEIYLNEDEFSAMVTPCLATVRQAVHGQMAVRKFGRVQEVLRQVFRQVRPNHAGANASYIPQLDEKHVEWDQFAISLTTIDGQHCSVGDSLNSFAIQSCSKPISFLCALRQFGVDYTQQFVGVEASGRPFNEVCLKKKGADREIPHNPCINAGAICTMSMVFPQYAEVKRLLKLLQLWRSLCRGLQPVHCEEVLGKKLGYGPFPFVPGTVGSTMTASTSGAGRGSETSKARGTPSPRGGGGASGTMQRQNSGEGPIQMRRFGSAQNLMEGLLPRNLMRDDAHASGGGDAGEWNGEDDEGAAQEEFQEAITREQMAQHVRNCRKSMVMLQRSSSGIECSLPGADGASVSSPTLDSPDIGGSGGGLLASDRASPSPKNKARAQARSATKGAAAPRGNYSDGENADAIATTDQATAAVLYGDPVLQPAGRCLMASDMHINRAMYESESLTANGNWCLAHLMVARNSFPPCFHEKGAALVKKHNRQRKEMQRFAHELEEWSAQRQNAGLASIEGSDPEFSGAEGAGYSPGIVVEKSKLAWIHDATAPVSASELALKETLETYFQACSIVSNNRLMSTMAGTLANCGRNVYTGTVCFGRKEISQVLPIMITAGMYDYSGQWGFDVGVPAKSGVGGCVYMVIPGLCGISVFSPRLDENGNSVRGVDACTRLSELLSLNTLSALQPSIATSAAGLGDSGGSSSGGKNGAPAGAAHQLLTPFDPRRATDPFEEQVAKTLKTAAWGDVQEMTKLFKAGVDLAVGDYDERTALHIAAAEGHTKVVHFLLLVLEESQKTKLDRWGQTAADGGVQQNRRMMHVLKRSGVTANDPESYADRAHPAGFERFLSKDNNSKDGSDADSPSTTGPTRGKTTAESTTPTAYQHEFTDTELPVLWAAHSEGELDELVMFTAQHGPEKLTLGSDYDKRTCFHLAVCGRALKNVKYLIVQARKCGHLEAMLCFRDRMGGTAWSDLERESEKGSLSGDVEVEAEWELLRSELEEAYASLNGDGSAS
mmetsp:Transcript_13996/g.34618  ORF Transcript_13996/g.34618 Transcript_13996/m.34618 type:complete len:1239 (-) Transcript_13996:1218-4934(-)